MRDHSEVAFFRFSGMSHVLICMQLRTLELLLNGWTVSGRCQVQPAVLHNRKSICFVRVTGSQLKDSIASRGVTTCAGMTAHTVILAQTGVGFLTGDRKQSFLDLLQHKQAVQNGRSICPCDGGCHEGFGHCASSWVLSTWKGLFGAAVHSCMVLGVCGSSAVPLLHRYA